MRLLCCQLLCVKRKEKKTTTTTDQIRVISEMKCHQTKADFEFLDQVIKIRFFHWFRKFWNLREMLIIFFIHVHDFRKRVFMVIDSRENEGEKKKNRVILFSPMTNRAILWQIFRHNSLVVLSEKEKIENMYIYTHTLQQINIDSKNQIHISFSNLTFIFRFQLTFENEHHHAWGILFTTCTVTWTQSTSSRNGYEFFGVFIIFIRRISFRENRKKKSE